MSATFWQCPLCRESLQETTDFWICENRHSFDKAKEGYVNLLLPNQKNSKAPGDSPKMVLARRAFLDQGHYAPLAHEIAKTITLLAKTDIPPTKSAAINIFDAGCGEGYYLHEIGEVLKNQVSTHYSGIDISKKAVQKAAKKYSGKRFAVASTFNLPLCNDSQDFVIQIFAPSKSSEINRILKNDAFWIWTNPHTEHLKELKHLVYSNPNLHIPTDEVPEGFKQVNRQRLTYTISLNDCEQRENLLMMTPFYWTISQDKKDILKVALTDVTIDFDIQVLQKV